MNERMSPAELEMQRIRIQDMLGKANFQVWSDKRFPRAHKPDVATLRNNIFFNYDDAPEAVLEPHPLLLPNIFQQSHVNLETERDRVRRFSDSWYNPVTRTTIYHPRLLKGKDDDLRRAVYNSAGADMSAKLVVTASGEYSDEDKEFVVGVLREVLVPGTEVPLSHTEIHQSGHRRILMASGHVVVEMTPIGVLHLNEMYPVAFELITDQLMRRQGDFHAFGTDAKSGKLRLQNSQVDPNGSFAEVLFEALTYIDWRDILTALKMTDIEKSVEHLDKTANTEDVGAGVFLELFKAVGRDKDQTQQLLRYLRSTL